VTSTQLIIDRLCACHAYARRSIRSKVMDGPEF